MKNVFYCFLICISFITCKTSGDTTMQLEGTYKGTFQQVAADGTSFGVFPVTLQLNKTNFRGKSDIIAEASIASGDFELMKNKIEFKNRYANNATEKTILSGSYQYKINDNILTIERNDNDLKDVYTLVRE